MKPNTKEVLVMKANGLLSKQIASKLSVHRRTVEWRIKAACNELGAKNITHAVAIAIKKGIILASEITCALILCGSAFMGSVEVRRGPSVRNTTRTAKREFIC